MDSRASQRQKVFLIKELDISIATIRSGLEVLQKHRYYGEDHFVYMLLLATGIERLLKIVLHLHALETSGAALPEIQMRKYSHNLIELSEEVVMRCYTPTYLRRPQAQEDLAFIHNDMRFTTMLALLSDFAKGQRYIYMDAIADPEIIETPPEDRWDALDMASMPEGEYIKLALQGREAEVIAHANRTHIICIERFIRALARLFDLAELGTVASMLSVTISDFAMLADEELGTTNYRFRLPGS